jgi:hypothetical protein
MVEFSCLLSLFENQYKWAIFHNSNEKKDVAVFFKFIKYEKFIKIELRNKSIIIRIENLKIINYYFNIILLLYCVVLNIQILKKIIIMYFLHYQPFKNG